MGTPVVTDHPEEHRYIATVDGEHAGFLAYVRHQDSDVVTLPHTVVDPAHEGEGVGSALTRFALDDLQAQGVTLVDAQCWFVSGWIDRHPEYARLRA